MSIPLSSISYKIAGRPCVGRGKHCVVRSGQETLARYVGRVITENGLNYREVARRSGGLISHSTVFDVVNGRNKNVSARTLSGLAKGLGVAEEEIFAVARGKSLEPSDIMEEVEVLFFGWDEASEEDKASTLDAIRMIASGFQQRRSRGAVTFSGRTDLKVGAQVRPKKPTGKGKGKGKK